MKILIAAACNREALGILLREYGYDSAEVETGAQVCRHLETHRDIDMVLMDITSPEMEACEAMRNIKSMAGDRLLPVLFVTDPEDEHALTRCLDAGGDDFVVKPVNEKVLIAKLKAHQRTIAIHRDLQESNRALQFHRRKMDREHSIVEHVFQKGMKRVDTNCDNVRFRVSPLSMFNGDLLLVAPAPSGGVYTLLGDFTGHGLAAAIGCLPVSDIFYAMTAKHASVGQIAAEMNLRLRRLLPDNMFFCATLIELNQTGDRLSIWSGGMNDLLIIDSNNQLEHRVQAQHMPLAILSVEEFEDDVQVIQPSEGARLCGYTDGVIEAKNGQTQCFGEARLLETLLSAPADGIHAVFSALEEFRAGMDQDDDTSLFELRCSEVIHSADREAGQGPILENDTEVVAIDESKFSQAAMELPLRLSLTLTPEYIRAPDVLHQLLDILGSVESVNAHRDILYTLLAELYNNAIEHGLLQLDSQQKKTPEGFVRYYERRAERLDRLEEGELNMQLLMQPATSGQPGSLHVRITDSGPGFDYGDMLAALDNSGLPFGRGIYLVKSLCEKLSYSNGGRTVEMIYSLA